MNLIVRRIAQLLKPFPLKFDFGCSDVEGRLTLQKVIGILTLKAYPFKTLATPGFVSYLVPAFSTKLRDAVACPKLDTASL